MEDMEAVAEVRNLKTASRLVSCFGRTAWESYTSMCPKGRSHNRSAQLHLLRIVTLRMDYPSVEELGRGKEISGQMLGKIFGSIRRESRTEDSISGGRGLFDSLIARDANNCVFV